MNIKKIGMISIGVILFCFGIYVIYGAFNNPYYEEIGASIPFMIGQSVIPIIFVIIGIYLIWRGYKI